MRKAILLLLMTCMMMPMDVLSQTYTSLWNQVAQAQEKDLPQTAMATLQKLAAKARKERAYGHLLKASLLYARLQAEVAPDSLQPAVERLCQQAEQVSDQAEQAVFFTVLSSLYAANPQLSDDHQALAADYRAKALAHPETLAGVRADSYVPFVITGKDSEVFAGDLLSVVGTELEAWDCLARYYGQSGNCRAACLSAVSASKARWEKAHGDRTAHAEYIGQLDSLISLYGDLPEAGEAAIARYDAMQEDPAVTPAQRYDWLQRSLQRWGTWKRANLLRRYEQQLTASRFWAVLDHRVAIPQQAAVVRLEQLRHLEQVTMRVYRTALQGDTELDPNTPADYQRMKGGLRELADRAQTRAFGPHPVYETFSDSLQLGPLQPGVYLLEFTSVPQTEVSRVLCFVSAVRTLVQPQPDNALRYVVVDASSGQPLAGAHLKLVTRTSWNQSPTVQQVTCDSQGEALFRYATQPPTQLLASHGSDAYSPKMYGNGRYYYYEREYNSEHTVLLADRAIYRPGQTVHVTAIVWRERNAIDNAAVEGKRFTIELRDANYKVVGEQQLTTDRYGRCSADFVLPTGQLNGLFTLRGNGNSASIRVEEYKRPTFRVDMPDYTAAYQGGDTVRARATALTYAGVPVQGATVRYTVKRQLAYWWMTYAAYWQRETIGRGLQSTLLHEAETVTADDGTFYCDVPLLLPDQIGRGATFYHFVVEADVTDVAGETRHATLTLPLGTRPTALVCDLPQKVRADQQPPLTFGRRNAAGQEIAGTVRYRIDGASWQQAAANQPCTLSKSPLKSGEHRLEAVCGADSLELTFVVFSLSDTKPALHTDGWFYVSHEQFPSDGQPVTLQVGSSDPGVHIVYGIFAGARVLERGVVEKSGELVNRQFSYKEEYGNGLLLTYAWVKDGKAHLHQQTIQRPLPDKHLQLSWTTFRDRLLPGQQEEWRLTIKNPDGTPADASLLAVLYDKSLDQLVPHEWLFSPTPFLAQPSASWLAANWGSISCGGQQSFPALNVPSADYSHFDSNVYPYYSYMSRSRGVVMYKSARVGANSATMAMAQEEAAMVGSVVAAADVVGHDAAANGLQLAEESPEEGGGQAAADGQLAVRENLQETAFCYPSLTTDASGGVTLRFTLPESLTTWRFMGLANTPDLLFGTIGGEAVARKDVMVQPNLPRFVRVGDEAQLSARIFNTSTHAVEGQALLQLSEPATGRIVYTQEVPFAVAPEQTAGVTFSYRPVTGVPALLVCKVVASGAGFSDGEQHYLSVLPDVEPVTKTLSFTQHGPGTTTLDLASLFPDGTTQRKLTVEYTNNPAWLMVQALPTLGQPWEHSAIEQAAAYYSNLLARTILAQNPQAKATFEQWRREPAGDQTLQSQLYKDASLRDLVLSETPWVADADRESEQRQQLSLFFDENGISQRLANCLDRLKRLQNPDGSFSWYPGMPGSTQVTAAVEEMLVRLNAMAGEQADTRQLHRQAFDYLSQEMVRLVAEMKKQEKKGTKPSFPSFTALRWLYLCALDGGKLSASAQSARDYLLPLLKRDIQHQTIYEKALTAVVLHRRGETAKAAEYVRSLKEYTVYSDEMGRYYDTPRAAYSWFDYKIPTEVAAMEAIRLVTPDDALTIDQMRRWLLQEKRTQVWDTPVSSVNAIYAFLFDRQDALAPSEPAALTVDGHPLELPEATAALGYVKTTVSDPHCRQFAASKTSEGTSWGALYAQFFQQTAAVEASSTGLSVRRELLADTPDGPLSVGRRVTVRITLDATRDLDFVQVVDRRAACLEPVSQLSGFRGGAYCSPKDNATHYFFERLAKGRHVIETVYVIDRAGRYETGTCTAGCAYAPEFRATAPSLTLTTVASPDGTIASPDGTVASPDGTVASPDGTVVTAPAANP